MPLDIPTWALVNKVIVIMINVIGLWLAGTTLVSGRSQKINKFYFFFSVCLLAWIDLQFLIVFSPLLFPMPLNILAALWAKRVIYAVLSLFFIFFYFFSIYFPRESQQRSRIFDRAYVLTWIVLMFLALSPWMITTVYSPDAITGPGEPLYFYAIIFSLGVCLYGIFGKNRYLTSQEKEKVQNFMRGAIIFGAFQAMPLQDVIYGSILGQYSLIFLLGFVAYAVNQKEIFELKVILVEILLGLIGTTLLLLPLIVESLWLKIVHYILFILFCVFFDLVMKTIVKEFQEKELLERKVHQRTEELEDAKRNLEESNAVLEVRVRARTLELERLNQTLEEKVKERTFDLQEKMKELERFNRLSVGRELKMIELKKKIKEMEERKTAGRPVGARAAKKEVFPESGII